MMPPAFEAALQVWITLTACAAIGLLSIDHPRSRWGFVIGIAGQPAWLYTSWAHGQYGILVATVFFTVAYATGIWNFWIKPLIDQPEV